MRLRQWNYDWPHQKWRDVDIKEIGIAHPRLSPYVESAILYNFSWSSLRDHYTNKEVPHMQTVPLEMSEKENRLYPSLIPFAEIWNIIIFR